MSIEIKAIQTGCVRIKESQRTRKTGGLARVFFDKVWTDWLPIYAWLILHRDGPILVDTGETALAASDPTYFPTWHPYYKRALEVDVTPAEEVGPQLKRLGVSPGDVRTVIMTHLHTDHAGGLRHFPKASVLVHRREYRLARSRVGRAMGYLPHRWPQSFAPIRFSLSSHRSVGPFRDTFAVTSGGDVVVVGTPGHTPHHVSVVVDRGDHMVFLAGDATYTQKHLAEGIVDGISLFPTATRTTIRKIRNLAGIRPLVYLPSHEKQARQRLSELKVFGGKHLRSKGERRDRPAGATERHRKRKSGKVRVE